MSNMCLVLEEMEVDQQPLEMLCCFSVKKTVRSGESKDHNSVASMERVRREIQLQRNEIKR